MNVNPCYRMSIICGTIFPSILNNYKGDWTYDDSMDALERYHNTGIELSATFDDNVDALESLETCYQRVKDLIEEERIKEIDELIENV